jgi:rhodanese-related sulfurtransferase
MVVLDMSRPINVRAIDREQLWHKIQRGDRFKLVMALSEFAFRAKRIPGSLHFSTPAEMFAALGKDEDIVVYCSNIDCHSSVAAYQSLVSHGYTNVQHYAGGLIDWEAAGLPLEGDWVTPGADSASGTSSSPT